MKPWSSPQGWFLPLVSWFLHRTPSVQNTRAKRVFARTGSRYSVLRDKEDIRLRNSGLFIDVMLIDKQRTHLVFNTVLGRAPGDSFRTGNDQHIVT